MRECEESISVSSVVPERGQPTTKMGPVGADIGAQARRPRPVGDNEA